MLMVANGSLPGISVCEKTGSWGRYIYEQPTSEGHLRTVIDDSTNNTLLLLESGARRKGLLAALPHAPRCLLAGVYWPGVVGPICPAEGCGKEARDTLQNAHNFRITHPCVRQSVQLNGRGVHDVGDLFAKEFLRIN